MAARPYATELRKVVGNLAARVGEAGHPLLEAERGEQGPARQCDTGTRVCAAPSTPTSSGVPAKRSLERADVELLLLGRRGADFFRRRPTPIRAEHTSLFSGVTSTSGAIEITDTLRAFTDGEYDAVYVIYNQFVSVVTQKLTCERPAPS